MCWKWRACRGVLTNDFDDRQGNAKAMYTAVIFNPVPGPPMGPRTRLGFRCWLKGTDKLRVQIYSLTNGYHRHLTLTDLPQEKWTDLTVDMTKARRPDGTGGPLSEGERIDDIQFYVEPTAELIIDDIFLYDAAVEGEKRPFPKKVFFTGWFDSGKQGQEWPGTFEIALNKGYFWHAAKAVPDPKAKTVSMVKPQSSKSNWPLWMRPFVSWDACQSVADRALARSPAFPGPAWIVEWAARAGRALLASATETAATASARRGRTRCMGDVPFA